MSQFIHQRRVVAGLLLLLAAAPPSHATEYQYQLAYKGVTPTPKRIQLNLSSTQLSFDSVLVGSASSRQTVTVTNDANSDGPLAVSTITSNGPYQATNNCGAPLSPGVSCSLGVSFVPTSAGSSPGAITIISNATNGTSQTITLAGTGVALQPGVLLSPASLLFMDQTVGTSSSAKTITLSNNGNTSLLIGTIAMPNGFAKTGDTCSGQTVAVNGSCTFSVAFAPTSVGSYANSQISISSNVSGGQTAMLTSGLAIAAQPDISFSPSSLSFSNTMASTSSSAQTVTIRNTGTANLVTTSIAMPANFSKSADTCSGNSVSPGGTCQFSVVFSPQP